MATFSPIQHPTYKVHDGIALSIADADANDRATSVWIDVSGWTDKAVAWEQDNAGTPDLDIIAHMSSQGAYELNNKTATTEDYEEVTIVAAHSGVVYVKYDSQDVDELQRTCRSMRIYVENDSATAVTSLTVWLEGSA